MEKDSSVDFGQPQTVEKAIKRNKSLKDKSLLIPKRKQNKTQQIDLLHFA